MRHDGHVATLSRALRPTVAAAVAALVTLAGCTSEGSTPTPSGTATLAPSDPATSTSSTTSTAAPTASASPTSLVVPTGDLPEVATGLDVPWAVAFLPDKTALVTQRDSAEIVQVTPKGVKTVVGTVPGVEPSSSESGLLGIAVAPDFGAEPLIYVYYTSADDNRVAAIPFFDGRLGEPRVILDGIPASPRHDGGRIAFGPDGNLYVGTGDAVNPPLAQDMSSLGGKILRMTVDGAPARGNPFPGSLVYSLGHRNVEGLAWDSQGRLWASEFGQDAWDELNLIQPGGNYGWPQVEGVGGGSTYVDPARVWRPVDASPSGMTLGPDGALYMAALRGESVWQITVNADGSTGEPRRLLQGVYGRIRDVVTAPSGELWVVTNNTARGDPRPGDDRILVVGLG